MIGTGCGPTFKPKPVTLTLTRADQLLCAVHRYTVWINGVNVGMIRNGATNTFTFIPKIDEPNTMYVEAYDPFVTNPVTNKVTFEIGSAGEMTGEVKWIENGTGVDLVLDLNITKEGEYPKSERRRRSDRN
jgi:hypothetical protein